MPKLSDLFAALRIAGENLDFSLMSLGSVQPKKLLGDLCQSYSLLRSMELTEKDFLDSS